MNRERVKTLILSLLVIISLLLTQQLWFPSPIALLKERTKQTNSLTTIESRKNLISPNAIIVSFGASDIRKNYYTILSSDLDLAWSESKDLLKDYFLREPEINQITKEAYIQNSISKSIELEFGDKIPTILVSSIFDSLENKIVRNIKEIKKILIPAFNRGIIYIVENNDSIYEVKLPNYEENTTLVRFLDRLEKGEYIKYHPIFSLFDSLFNELAGNYTPMPITYSVTADRTLVESQININNEVELIEQVKNFFNEDFDFVKTIKETSGAIVYIYGYGEKSVRVNDKGALEYNEQIGNVSSTSILASLDAAIDFISKNGGLSESLYLKEIQHISSGGNKGYKFSFSYRLDGIPVEFSDTTLKHPIEIEVYGDKIKAYRSLVRKVMDIEVVSPDQSVLYFPDIINKNIQILKSKYFDTGNLLESEIDDSQRIFEILKNIEEVRMVYYDAVDQIERQVLKPSWMIKIKGDLYYFDCYTGELIHSITLN